MAGLPQSAEISAQFNFLHIAGPTFEQVQQQYDVDFVGARLSFNPQDFARTIAKIAFTAAIYVIGIAPFKSSPIRRVILGEDPCVGHWVGSCTGEPVNEPKGLHGVKIKAAGSNVHVFLRLFAQFDAPEYHVVLGPADPDFVKSEDWPWK